MGLFFSDIYPGSISDNCITEKSGVVQWIQPEHELMEDRGFAIQDLCALKGIYLNRPAQKLSDQFTWAEVASNFSIASTRIHVEQFIGRVREWSIFECCLASATNGLTILHLAGIVPHCQPDNAPYWSKRKQMKEDGL